MAAYLRSQGYSHANAHTLMHNENPLLLAYWCDSSPATLDAVYIAR